ncbi:hypothetical protein [Neolewinella persica]|uniref:hypothetical protein n=1 Tax=Neolewinella persica TaxID=70998 RepID=UPI00036F8EB0|nr:hypothetical protein [Neolewinella persica]
MYNIETIFAVPGSGQSVYTLRFKEESYANSNDNELYKVFRQWQDGEYLSRFFRANKTNLEAYYGKGMTSLRAMERTLDESHKLFKKLIAALSDAEAGNFSPLSQLFTNVDDSPRFSDYVEQKIKRSWLRLFAVRTDDGLFFITGGAIKLTASLQGDNPHDPPQTDKELKKARAVAKYFREVVDKDKFYEVYEMII